MGYNKIDLEFILGDFTKVEFYGYRTASVTGHFFQCNRRSKDATALEQELAKKAGVKTDNHTVYTIENGCGVKIHVLCTDDTMYFGSELHEGSW